MSECGPRSGEGRLIGNLTVVVAAIFFTPLHQLPAQNLSLQMHGMATLAARSFFGAGVGGFWRDARRLGVGGSISLGEWDRELAGRGEIGLSYHLGARDAGALGLYLGGGVAAAFAARRSEQYLTVFVGLEQDSRGRAGWFAEAGIGGGVRLVAGYRILLRRRGA